jgi:diaminopropionate ammonia-lyase
VPSERTGCIQRAYNGVMQNISFSETGLILPETPLRSIPELARRAGVRQLLVKQENERPFGNFKILGGMYAGLRMLADVVGVGIGELADPLSPRSGLPRLICASDGNHGLSVAAAARLACAPATIFLHHGVDQARANKIREQGAAIAWIEGTYDDAVDAALAAAGRGDGILVPDTSDDPDCGAVRHVMQGYSILTDELRTQLDLQAVWPTHSFIQAGVGGLAAAIASGLRDGSGYAPDLVIVEPDAAPCVGYALATGRLSRFPGDLVTSAEMLSCGLASAPALATLLSHGAHAMTVTESELNEAVRVFADLGGAETTASGAAGLAGLLRVAADAELRNAYALTEDSIILLIMTEARPPLG